MELIFILNIKIKIKYNKIAKYVNIYLHRVVQLNVFLERRIDVLDDNNNNNDDE